ncbi:hypothetical protein [Ralstonia pseudosolanacearum]|uniref:hypothetical protein n=1 Tax=Ralstonia pseudosolanacearum TaxID=1310165 RepID=UPI0023DA6832|nr:hypothetical protein [Ralstonia pseudosolanacearum]
MRLAFDRFTVVLDACVLFPMTVRDVLLTLADHEFFNPKWSARLHEEWGTNLVDRRQAAGLPGDVQAQVAATRQSMDRAFPDALVQEVLPETANVAPVDPKRPPCRDDGHLRARRCHRDLQPEGLCGPAPAQDL